MSEKPVKAFDLVEFNKSWYEAHIKEAIEINDKASIAKNLRSLSSESEDDIPVSKELLNKLADYLDPAIEKHFKTGRKVNQKRSFTETSILVGCYTYLCENKEEARLFLNHRNKAFTLVKNSDLYDINGNFSPQWEYPGMEQERKQMKYPTKGQIKEFVCSKILAVSTRTFDDMLSRIHR